MSDRQKTRGVIDMTRPPAEAGGLAAFAGTETKTSRQSDTNRLVRKYPLFGT